MTAAGLESRLIRHFGGSRADARRVVRSLIVDGRLAYVYLYGQSYIDLGFRCPTPITRRVILYPQGCKEQSTSDALAIVIESGAAFGDGRHPSTRLAVEGLEAIQYSAGRGHSLALRRGIDIGTGSGILAIAAARLGVEKLDALDIDPCARDEARRNMAHNRLGQRVTLCRKAIEDLDGDYDLVMANLRLPTLCALAAWVQRRTHPSSYLVFSGFRDHEQGALQGAYPESSFRLIWSRTEAGWGGIVFQSV
jgi:ribosomal protein L11 methyltransferase